MRDAVPVGDGDPHRAVRGDPLARNRRNAHGGPCCVGCVVPRRRRCCPGAGLVVRGLAAPIATTGRRDLGRGRREGVTATDRITFVAETGEPWWPGPSPATTTSCWRCLGRSRDRGNAGPGRGRRSEGHVGTGRGLGREKQKHPVTMRWCAGPNPTDGAEAAGGRGRTWAEHHVGDRVIVYRHPVIRIGSCWQARGRHRDAGCPSATDSGWGSRTSRCRSRCRAAVTPGVTRRVRAPSCAVGRDRRGRGCHDGDSAGLGAVDSPSPILCGRKAVSARSNERGTARASYGASGGHRPGG